ncbi:alpha/beta hydrolase [Pseudoalteromonas sp. J010]|uniref:alpha/beta hydrolase n=1 Tax=Pseudoalteromonas sp. J010 TaxID=998465 RepID=UPI000F65183F|nr:alpha/beta hydrolase [Pseudoalteromonas sp. J010]RRS06497.1 alpha/beta hydrolase [Pseudoalteromonas sp. J010]
MKHILLLFILALAGCAGLHSMPPKNYSHTDDESTYRVFFDQYGDLYPSSSEAIMPERKTFGRNYAFSIRTYMKNTNQEYNENTIEAHYSKLVSSISDKMNKQSKLVLLIHGFNNSYEEANLSFEYIKSHLNSKSDSKFIFIEVYWDGLFKGPFSSPLPLAYWFDSLTYSNIAGQVGLRKLLNRLPHNTNLTIITHSRGAGVAFSAISNPVYDKHIIVPEFEDYAGDNISSLNIVAIAPAVGNGHPLGDPSSILNQNSRVFIGFNENDPALQKSKVGSGKFGDTSLGTDNKFYLKAEKLANVQHLTLQRVVYENYNEHGIRGYIDLQAQTDCLFWAANLFNDQPQNCSLSR